MRCLQLIIVSLAISFCHCKSRCPPAEMVKPCKCHFEVDMKVEILCDGNRPIDLKKVFTRISKAKVNKVFDRLHIKNMGLKVIEEDTTKNIIFEDVTIRFEEVEGDSELMSAKSLRKIHSKAFQGTAKKVKTFFFRSQQAMENNKPYNIYDLINSMTNIQTIHLDISNKTVPPKAFAKLKYLNTLDLLGDRPYTIKDYAFHNLNNLTSLILAANKFSKNSLRIAGKSTQELAIRFHDTIQPLDEKSFVVGSLSNLARPINLLLWGNKLTYLAKDVFLPFLRNRELNRISINENPINCTDCRTYWLIKRKERYHNRVKDGRCGGTGEDIYEVKWNCK